MQAIQFSMLTTSADSALRLDGVSPDSTTEAGAEANGSGFVEVLNGITKPAKNGLTGTKLRHVPAGTSLLMSATQTLSDGSKVKFDSETGTEEESLLTSSLLGQIALKDKLPATDSETSNSDAASKIAGGDLEGEAVAVLSDNTASSTANDTQSITVGTTPEISLAESNASELHKAASKLPRSASELTDIVATELQEKASRLIADDTEAGKIDVKLQGAGGGKGEAQPVADLAGAVSSVSAQNEADSAAIAQFAQETDSGNELQEAIKDNRVNVTPETGVKADGSINKADEARITVGAATQAALRPDANTNVVVSTEGSSETDSSVVGNKLTPASVADKADNQVGAKAGSEQNTAKQDAQQQAGSQHSSSQHNSQHGQKQNTHAQLPNDIAPELSDSSAATAKLAADASASARADTTFTGALQAAEQRQQTGVAQPVSRSLAEQLKQSINLMQQDAAGQLRERVTLMLRQNIQIAEIRLDPAGLGQMQIKIDMQQDQASVQFIVQQSQAKELIEQQLPRLREMLQQQGIQLAEGQVQQQSQQERQLAQREGNNQSRNGNQAAGETQEQAAETVQVNIKTSDRLVDYYA